MVVMNNNVQCEHRIFDIFLFHKRCNAKSTRIIIVWVINKVGTVLRYNDAIWKSQATKIHFMRRLLVDSIYHDGDHVIKDYV